VSWIADKLARSWGDGASWVLDGAIQHHEARSLKLDASKAAVFLGWHPLLPLDLALDWIVEWYRAFQRGEDLRELTLKQIAKYEELAARQQ
jgi:CDP-glucose 4,6-dehydratase